MSRSEKRVLTGVAVLAVLTIGLATATAVAYNQSIEPLPTQAVLVEPVIDSTQAIPATRDPSIGLVQLPPLTLGWTPSPTSPPDLATPTPSFSDYKFVIGQSVKGRNIVGYAFPITDSPRGLVLVNGIHGDEVNAWPILQSIMLDLQSKSLAQPENLSVYFIESLNPDGTALTERLNANRIDLNRNWDTYDWRTGIQISPSDFLPVGGGPRPFSEPETQALRDLLSGLKDTHTESLTVIYFHAAVPPAGYVGPGTHRVGGQDLADTASRELGEMFAEVSGYKYANQWVGEYAVTGDASTWAVAQGMLSLTIELPTRYNLNDEQAALLHNGLASMIEYLANR
jgi:hypothetical protein